MASYIEEKAAINKLDWAMSFQRTGKFPLDRSSMFATYADAVAYAKGDGSDSRAIGGTSYVGQVITVFENDVVTVYKINADRTLGEVGKATSGDEKSIHLTDEGILALYGFDTATDGQMLRMKVTEEGRSIEWYTPDSSTVEGLQAAVQKLQDTVGDATKGLVKDVADQGKKITEIEGKLTGALHYKGSCKFAELPVEGNVNGDVWNVEDAGGKDAHGNDIHAGDNVIWNGTGWDVSTGTIDLSAYAKSADVTKEIGDAKTELQGKIDDVANAATKVEASETNGNVKVDGKEVKVYTLPTATADAIGGVKIAAAGTADKVVLDAEGVAGIDKVSAAKIDGIVAEAAKVTHSVKMGTKTFDGSADITFTADDLPLPEKVVTNDKYGTDTVGGAVKSSDAQDQVAIGTDGKMTVNDISATKVKGSVDSAKKVDHTLTMGTKTFDGSADVSFTTDDLPLPDDLVHKTDLGSATAAGLVKSSTDKDKVAIGEDGTMSLNTVSGSKIDGAVAKATDADKLGGVAAADVFVAGADTTLTSKVKAAAAADQLAAEKTISVTGDATGNAKFDGSKDAAIDITLKDSGVTAGTYTKVTVDAQGRATKGETLDASDIPDLTLAKITDAGTLAGKDEVARTDITAEFEAQIKALENGNHTHANKTVLDGVTTAKVTAWDKAVEDVAKKADSATTLAGYGIEDAYTKTEIDGKLGGAFHYKDSVDAFTDLPEDPEIGDVYNIKTAGGTDSQGIAVKAGDNVVCKSKKTETEAAQWDVLSGTVDLSAYDTRAQVEAKIKTAQDTLQGNIDAATGRLDTLEGTVGDADSGLVKKVNDVVTAEAADAKKIAALEGTVGDDTKGLVKSVTDNTAAITKLNGDTDVEGSVKNLIAASATDLSTKVDNITKDGGTIDTKVAAHNTDADAHAELFAAKQNKVFQKTLTVAKASFAAAAADEPGDFVGSFTIAGIDTTKNYKVDVVPVIDTTATHKAILAAGFLPMTSFEAGVLKLYALKTPTADFEASLTFTQIQ
nr:MAG TPA: Dec protein, OB-Fold, Decoration, VIRAL PROTEIN [Caudoviricetes sp.]